MEETVKQVDSSVDHTPHLLICTSCGAVDLGKLTFEDNKGWFLRHSLDCHCCGARLPDYIVQEVSND